MDEDVRLVAVMDRLRRLDLTRNPMDRMGLSPSQMMLVQRVAETPGVRLTQAARGLDLTPPTVSVAVRRLEKAGLLRRETDPSDSRALRLFATAKGLDLCSRVGAFRRGKMRGLLSGLEPRERARVVELLEKALERAEKAGKERQG